MLASLAAPHQAAQADFGPSEDSADLLPELSVEYATYGAGGKTCDAAIAVRDRCQNQSKCRVYAGNHLCGDPIRGTKKYLVISFYCAGERHRISVRETQSKSLNCRARAREPDRSARAPSTRSSLMARRRRGPASRGGIMVLYAQYASNRYSCDATFKARRACDGLSRCAVRAGNQLCGDPAEGYRKRLRLGYRCLGVTRHLEVHENSSARLSCGAPASERTWRSPGNYSQPHQPPKPEYGRYGLHITDVIYEGTNGNYCDATLKVRRACDGRRRCSISAGNRLCGDPQRSIKKRLSVGYHCGGRRRVVQAQEGSTATVGCR